MEMRENKIGTAKMVWNTIKWDGWDHWMYGRWIFAVLAILLVLSQLMPVSWVGGSYNAAGFMAYIPMTVTMIVSAGLGLIGGYYMFVYPILSTVWDACTAGALTDRMSNRPYALLLGVRLFWNIVAFFFGYGVLLVSQRLLLRFATDTISFLNINIDMDTIVGIDGGLGALFDVALFLPITVLYFYFFVFAEKARLNWLVRILAYAVGVFALLGSTVFNLFSNNLWNEGVPMVVNVALFVCMYVLCCWVYEKKLEIK